MKLIKHLLASAVLLATSSLAIAAQTDTADITINVTKDAFVNFTGSVDTSTAKALSLAEVSSTSTSIGDLGLESNVAGDCSVQFTTANTFKLKLAGATTDTFLHDATEYTLGWNGNTISSTNNTVNVASNCNVANTSLDFITSTTPSNTVAAGIYSDTVTMTVTTQ